MPVKPSARPGAASLRAFQPSGAHWEWASGQVSHFPNGCPGDKEAPGIGKAFLQGIQQIKKKQSKERIWVCGTWRFPRKALSDPARSVPIPCPPGHAFDLPWGGGVRLCSVTSHLPTTPQVLTASFTHYCSFYAAIQMDKLLLLETFGQEVLGEIMETQLLLRGS